MKILLANPNTTDPTTATNSQLPSVKIGEERLRVNVTRGHTQEDLDRTLGLLKEYGEAFFVLSGEDIGELEAD